jgi:hypothetical protein
MIILNLSFRREPQSHGNGTRNTRTASGDVSGGPRGTAVGKSSVVQEAQSVVCRVGFNDFVETPVRRLNLTEKLPTRSRTFVSYSVLDFPAPRTRFARSKIPRSIIRRFRQRLNLTNAALPTKKIAIIQIGTNIVRVISESILPL